MTPDIPEIKYTKQKPEKNPFAFVEAIKLRPKKKEEKYKKYAGLNRRMIASTIDIMIMMLPFTPIIDWIARNIVNSRNITLKEMESVLANTDLTPQLIEVLKIAINSGKLQELLLGTILQILILLSLSAICWKLWSATPGKILLRMKIVDADTEQPMTNKQILKRCLGYIPACGVFFLGIIWISFNKSHQGWHDKIANTVVIIKSRKKEKSPKSTDNNSPTVG